jgi:hypothetical protein
MPISGTLTPTNTVGEKDTDLYIDLGASGTFVDVSTWSTEVSPAGGESATGETYRLSGDPIISMGNKAPRTITVTSLYDTAATGVFQNIYAAYEAGTAGRKCDIRWNAKAAAAGQPRFTTSGGVITSCSLPNINASSSTPSTFTFTIFCSAVVESDIPA